MKQFTLPAAPFLVLVTLAVAPSPAAVYPAPELAVPNWPPHDGNWPLPSGTVPTPATPAAGRGNQ